MVLRVRLSSTEAFVRRDTANSRVPNRSPSWERVAFQSWTDSRSRAPVIRSLADDDCGEEVQVEAVMTLCRKRL